MKPPRFLLGTSVFTGGKPEREQFTYLWTLNQARREVQPVHTIILAEGNSKIPYSPPNSSIISLPGDLGHIGMHLAGEKKHDFTGWSASMCALAMMAYVAEADFVYQESDCLLFGPCVTQAYRDMQDGLIVFGAKHKSPPWQWCSQSFFVVRHSFIPALVAFYLAQGPDAALDNTGEHKFKKLEAQFGTDVVKRLSFGVDRERPLPFDAPCWYGQQFTASELEEITGRGLI